VTLGRRALLQGAILAGSVLPFVVRSAFAQTSDQPDAAFVRFRTAPFPYNGVDPLTGQPFLDVDQNGRQGHTSSRGGIYWQDTTYSDNRVLLAFSRDFDLDRPGVMVVYFHGNEASLDDDVLSRQRVLDQFEAAGINGVLVVPQFAVNALDSSAGKFWRPGAVGQFLSEAAYRLAEFFDESARAVFARLPVILIAYSGGYEPAAYALTDPGVANRTIGAVLIDAVFGEEDRFVDFVLRHRSAFFLSAYTDASHAGNQQLENTLQRRGIGFVTSVPDRLVPGLVGFIASPGDHADLVTDAWVPNPITWIIRSAERPD
jgi:hypothetical protein